ncbi:hypothetical protein ANN_20285 [Periplaneta americana]|uniref:Uncharacterized protein n=1 Tax=Periplaneta americana TaxID=6978 RepID=A0ABQ8SC80_PERAM|nr:hypothetical protein ANN_20285 [Periplaneta americana]
MHCPSQTSGFNNRHFPYLFCVSYEVEPFTMLYYITIARLVLTCYGTKIVLQWLKKGKLVINKISQLGPMDPSTNSRCLAKKSWPVANLNAATDDFRVLTCYGTKIVLQWLKEGKLVINKISQLGPMDPSTNSRRLRLAGHVARMGESRNAYRVLVGRPEEEKTLERPRRRWEDNIKIDLGKVGNDGRDWINPAQDMD